MSEELKPCPFCGSHDVEVHGKPAILDALDSVCCNECTADAPYPVWNTRAALKAGHGEVVAWIKPDVLATLRADECCYAFGQQDKKKNLIPLYTAPPATGVIVPRELLGLLRSAWKHMPSPESPDLDPQHVDELVMWHMQASALLQSQEVEL